jgi:hypothetical protein
LGRPTQAPNSVESVLFPAQTAESAGDGVYARSIRTDQHDQGTAFPAGPFAAQAIAFKNGSDELDNSIIGNRGFLKRVQLSHKPRFDVAQAYPEPGVLCPDESTGRVQITRKREDGSLDIPIAWELVKAHKQPPFE